MKGKAADYHILVRMILPNPNGINERFSFN